MTPSFAGDAWISTQPGLEGLACAPPRVDDSLWVPRDAVTAELKKAAKMGNRVALLGPGGAGKSFLAFRFFHFLESVYPEIPKCHLVMEPSDREALTADLLRRMGAEPTENFRDNRDRLAALWMRNPGGMLLLDNALSQEDVDCFLPPESAGWLVILTCQNKSLINDYFHDIIDVREFEPEESLELFQKRIGPERFEREKEEISLLCEDLGRLPIAVAAASGMMKKRRRTSAGKLREEFAKELSAIEMAFPQEEAVSHEDAARNNIVSVILRMSLEDLNREPEPARKHVWALLGALSLFHPASGGDGEAVAATARFSLEDGKQVQHAPKDYETSPTNALETLDLLVDRSLATVENNQGQERFFMHRLVAKAVWEELDNSRPNSRTIAPEYAPSLDRLQQSFCHFWTCFVVYHNNSAAHQIFFQNWDNILIAMQILIDSKGGTDWQQPLWLHFAIGVYQWLIVQKPEQLNCIRIILEKANCAAKGLNGAIIDQKAFAYTLKALGDLDYHEFQLDSALARYRESFHEFQLIDDSLGQANTLKALGDLYLRDGRLKDASENYLLALNVYTKINDLQGQANTLQALGDINVRVDHFEQAIAQYGRALRIYEEVGDRLGQANTLKIMADLDAHDGRLEAALERYISALAFYEEVGNLLGLANTYKAMGDLDVREKHFGQAVEHYVSAFFIYESINSRIGIAEIFSSFGKIAMQVGKLDLVTEFARLALEIRIKLFDRVGLRMDFGTRGYNYLKLNKPEEAILSFEESLRALPLENDPFGYGLSMAGQALAFRRLGLMGGVAGCLSDLSKLLQDGQSNLEDLFVIMKEQRDFDLAAKLKTIIENGGGESLRMAHVMYVAENWLKKIK
ncbi:NB-ARC domain protein [Desulfatibacillum aliphaticivorans]|uniref:NB-ARC domain protein n=1 Tax=Desulfatibacillum aliphaticivorans TaxID=218208 RepID=B8FHL9_DESAL|nr:tetratricopeptide repeat protein [Desulfatibacillum aliphaticivorans]ACL02307.1 NB-ARC domain protein [Desulfatibacillum aliphaticivorans]